MCIIVCSPNTVRERGSMFKFLSEAVHVFYFEDPYKGHTAHCKFLFVGLCVRVHVHVSV